MTKKFCPECNVLLSSESYCFCGWRNEKPSSKKPHNMCHYSFNGTRCPLLGTISNSTKSSGTLYCSLHYQTLGSQDKAREALEYAIANQQAIQNSRIDWRARLWMSDPNNSLTKAGD